MSAVVCERSSALSLDGLVEMAEFVYFQQHDHQDWIRIGWTGTPDGRREYDQKDFKPVAVLPATYASEQALHRHFADHRVDRTGDSSTYAGDQVYQYVESLLLRSFAGHDRREAEGLPVIPFSVWSPVNLRNEGRNGEQHLFAELPRRDRISYARSDLAHLSSDSDEWYTPEDILEAARNAMGGIDTDPATCLVAQRKVGARLWYTAAQDGLRTDLPWDGNVWLNPPYGRGESSATHWVRRLVNEIEGQNVTQAITCLNIASATALWFQQVWANASVHLIYRDRPDFWNERRQQGSASKGIILSYFGHRADAFAETFSPMGVVIEKRTRCLP